MGVMDQTIMPGVGNIMKSEGLFRAGVHPLKHCKTLSIEELRGVVEELNRFALEWYLLCKSTGEGAPRASGNVKTKHSEEMLQKYCYGRVDCVRCGEEIYCIKVGQRRRITYFCNVCQPTSSNTMCPVRRRHKLEMPFRYPVCLCRAPARMMHVFHYGRDHRRIFFACREAPQSPTRCRYRSYLDESGFVMPNCSCQPPQPMVFRRVMGLVDNGRYFAQCARKLCKRRVWLAPLGLERPDSQELTMAPAADSVVSTQERWSRHRRAIPVPVEAPARLFVQRSATGEFMHGRRGVAQTGKHLLSVPDKRGVVQTLSDAVVAEQFESGTCTPVTSGAEELLDDEEEMCPGLPELKDQFEKRWQRRGSSRMGMSVDTDEQVNADELFANRLAFLDICPTTSAALVEELLLFDGLTIDEVAVTLSS